ncbi:MAG: peptidase bleomycin hydrolase [Bacteroidota bacterium]|jgi:bleomycin hydrolase
MQRLTIKAWSLVAAGLSLSLQAQSLTNKPGSEYAFTEVYNLEETSIKDQCRTGTCWSYSTLSMVESELIRTGKGSHDLSEMYIARCAYIEKAITYVRMGGKHQFDEGGEFHDIPYIIEKYGIVPEEVYSGLKHGNTRHNHAEMVSALGAFVQAISERPSGSLSEDWVLAVQRVVDAYLGDVPTEFTYQGKTYTPQSFAASLGLNMQDYVAITSFTHHPYYRPFAIEVVDNWSMQTAYNVPLQTLIDASKEALKKGYSIAWATDVSEKGFSYRDGLAIVPTHDSLVQKMGNDPKHFNAAGAERISNAFQQPMPEKSIDANMRQLAFDRQETTDDHGMHITGMVSEAQSGDYFVVKNSWGEANSCGGYLYASEAFFAYKTICIMVHKDALSKALQRELGL